jgi:hypothetical protein
MPGRNETTCDMRGDFAGGGWIGSDCAPPAAVAKQVVATACLTLFEDTCSAQ